MATEKQIAANRRNALKSTGPRTPRGKAFTRLNALRHGLRATAGIPRGASLKELNQIRDWFVRQCQPQTAEQVRLVAQMATARWQLLYWQRHWQMAETRILGEASGAGPPGRVAILDRFAQRQARYGRAFTKACREYERSTRAEPQPESYSAA
jgi:hypothetical protein